MAPTLFVDLSIILLLVIVFSTLAKILRQPLILGYILAGVAASPLFLDALPPPESLSIFSEMGVAVLLFIVGLNLNPQVIREVGMISSITAVGQVAFTSLAGYAIMLLLGFPHLTSLYVSVAFSFSSTIIVMKLLSDKGELDALHGRIAIGFLLVQDVLAILLLVIIPSLSGVDMTVSFHLFALQGLGILLIIFFLGVHLLPRLMQHIAHSQEYLMLFAISWCFTLASVFYFLGMSIEIGALLAGVTLASSSYRHEISSRLRPLRDFFIVMFFITLGSGMVFSSISTYAFPIMILSLFVLVGNPLIVLLIMRLVGYSTRTGFLMGLAIAQISEFSLILIALGAQLGHVSQEIVSLVTVVGLITIAGSSYLILYSQQIYRALSPLLRIFDLIGPRTAREASPDREQHDIILFGSNRIGLTLIESLRRTRRSFLVIDFNPDTIARLQKMGVPCRYGDAGNPEMLEDLNLAGVKMVLSTIPDRDINILLVRRIRAANRNAIILVVSNHLQDSLKVYEAGASYVVMPHFIAAHHTSAMIEEFAFNIDKFLKYKATHLHSLRRREALHKQGFPS